MSINLDELLAKLGDEGQEKQASEAAPQEAPTVAEELRGVLMTKSASARQAECEDLGRVLAQRLLEKAAAESKEEEKAEKDEDKGDKEEKEEKDEKDEDKGQEKKASLEDLVAARLSKEAGEVAPQANLSIEPNASMASDQMAVEAAAKQSGGTVEQQSTESLQKGLATQSAEAGAYDQVEANLQKAAAVSALVGDGIDFYDACNLVAQADMELQKEAAFNELIEQGLSFEDAVTLVKQASEADYVEAGLDKQAAFEQLLSEGLSFDEAVAAVSGL